MPMKCDESGKRWIEMELLVPGTPEQVWAALATGEGNAGWFLRAEIEPRVGGLLRYHFGQGVTSEGEVTEWAPPHRLGYLERGWSEGAPPIVTEITITGRGGDRCVLRMVHALFTEADTWDDEVEGFERGWPAYFALLRLYLTHFAGQPAASFMAGTVTAPDGLAAWHRLNAQLGLTGASVGERRVCASGPEPWAGEVVFMHQDAEQRFVIVRTETPAPGFLLTGTHSAQPDRTRVSLGRYLYGADTARAPEVEAAWRAWLTEQFPPLG